MDKTIIIALVVILLVGASAGLYYFMFQEKDEAMPSTATNATANAANNNKQSEKEPPEDATETTVPEATSDYEGWTIACGPDMISADGWTAEMILASSEPYAFLHPATDDDFQEVYYTNASQLAYVIPVEAGEELKLPTEADVKVTAEQGTVSNVTVFDSGAEYGECGGPILDISFDYSLSDRMLNQNREDTLVLTVTSGNESLEHSIKIIPAYWMQPSLSEGATLAQKHSSLYQANAGEAVTYTVKLQTASGDPVIGKTLSLPEQEDPYVPPAIQAAFRESEPGLYTTVLSADQSQTSDLRVVLDNGIANPKYNTLKLTFTDAEASSIAQFPERIVYSMNPNFIDANGEKYFYAHFQRKVALDAPYNGYTYKCIAQRITASELPSISLPDDIEQVDRNVILAVSLDGALAATTSAGSSTNSIQIKTIDSAGEIDTRPDYITLEEKIEPVQLQFTPDNTKLIIQSETGLHIADASNKTVIHYIPYTLDYWGDLQVIQITDTHILVGLRETKTYQQQSTMEVYLGTDETKTTLEDLDEETTRVTPSVLQKINLETGAVEKETTLHQDGKRVLAITPLSTDQDTLYVAYGLIEEESGSWCKTFPIYSSTQTQLASYSASTLEQIKSFEIKTDTAELPIYHPGALLLSDSKLVLVAQLRSDYCNSSGEPIVYQNYAYVINPDQKSIESRRGMVTENSSVSRSYGDPIMEYITLSGSTLIHIDKSYSTGDSSFVQQITTYDL